MQHFYIRKVGILLAKSAFLLCGLGAIWMMLSLVEPSGVYGWWSWPAWVHLRWAVCFFSVR